MWDTKPDAFIVAATLPPELAYWVGHWAHNPAGVPKPIQEDEFGRLDLGDLDVWLRSCTVAPETYKGKFIAALWDIFLTIGRWAELAGDDRWAELAGDDGWVELAGNDGWVELASDDRWAELASNDGWVLPTADNLRNNILA